MSTHNICFRGEIRKILCGYPLLSVAMSVLTSSKMWHLIWVYTVCTGLSVGILTVNIAKIADRNWKCAATKTAVA